MSNTFLILTDVYGDRVRVNANHIISYRTDGPFTEVKTVSNSQFMVQDSVESLDKAFVESFFMIKTIPVVEVNNE